METVLITPVSFEHHYTLAATFQLLDTCLNFLWCSVYCIFLSLPFSNTWFHSSPSKINEPYPWLPTGHDVCLHYSTYTRLCCRLPLVDWSLLGAGIVSYLSLHSSQLPWCVWNTADTRRMFFDSVWIHKELALVIVIKKCWKGVDTE